MSEVLFTGGQVLLPHENEPSSADLLIRDGVIAAIGTDARSSASSSAEERVVEGRTVLPGFIDAHVHVMIDGANPFAAMLEPFSLPFYRATEVLRRTLDVGITTVRDAGGADLGLKQAQRNGLVDGPELVIAVNILSQTGGHADGHLVSGQACYLLPEHPGRPGPVVDGPDAMRKRVREMLRAGADVIKICTSGGVLSETDDPKHPQFDESELDVCVRTAAANNVPVMAHSHGRDGIVNALNAGVRSIEHGIYADEACFALMKEQDAWLVPTLLAPVALVRMIENGAQLSEAVVAKAYAVLETHREMAKHAVAAGVKIAFGTDAGVFAHGMNLEEFALLHQAGMRPVDVLRAATEESAELLGLSDRGRIEVGKRADLVVLSGDPFEFSAYHERVAGVVQAGNVVRWTP